MPENITAHRNAAGTGAGKDRPVRQPAGGKRMIEEIDMVKGTVILFIFFIHLFDMTGITDLYLSYTGWLYSGATLLLMIICFLCSGYVYSGRGSVRENIIKYGRRLLVPRVGYGLIFLAVYFLRYVIIEAKPVIWYLDNALPDLVGLQNWNIRLGQAGPNQMIYAFVAYWFVDELFIAFCIFIPLRKLTEGGKPFVRVLCCLALLAAAGLCNHFDIQHTLKNTYATGVPYILILINAFGFAALLMTGNLLKEIRFFEPERHSRAFSFAAAGIALTVLVLYAAADKEGDYALQYGKWGAYGGLSMLMTPLVAAALLYLLVFVFSFVKRVSFIKRSLCFLGRNTLDILLTHIGVAEIISWIGGFWQDLYNESFRAEQFSVARCLTVFGGTAAVIAVLLAVKPRLKRAGKKTVNGH